MVAAVKQGLGHLPQRVRPLSPRPRHVEHPGVIDRHPGCSSQRDDEFLVLAGELQTTHLVCEVDVAEHLAAHMDGGPEEGRHHRVSRREADSVGVFADRGQPQRSRVADERAQDTVSERLRSDPTGLLRRQPRRDKLHEPFTVGAQHTQGAVPGPHEVASATHDPSEHL